MLRSVSSNLAGHILGDVLTIAYCVKLTRTDSTVMGFTTYDRDIYVDNGDSTTTLYEAASAVEASALRAQATQGVTNMEIVGMLTSARITDDDIRAGKYDFAAFEFFIVNYNSLADGRLIIATGNLGELAFNQFSYTAELRSLMQRTEQQVGELTSPTCRVKQLGDARCKVVLTPFRFARTVTVATSVYQFSVTDAAVTDYYTYGKVEVTTGSNAGIWREIKNHTFSGGSAIIVVQEPFPYAFTVGDAVTLEAGCDRQFSTCKNKFSNLVNFRGEPYIPGTDQIMRRGRR